MFLEYIFDDVCVLTIFEFFILPNLPNLQKMQKSKKNCVMNVSSKKNWHLPSFYQNVRLSQTHIPEYAQDMILCTDHH